MKSQLINAPAMADGSSSATPHQIDPVPRSPSKKKAARDRRRPDPLALVWAPEIVAMLEAAPGMRPVAVFKELRRRHPEISQGVRRTLERRIQDWRTLNDPGCDSGLQQDDRRRQHITNTQMRTYAKLRQTNTVAIAAEKARFSPATAYRIEGQPRLPPKKKGPRDRRRPDPLAPVWTPEILPMLESAPTVRAVTVLKEIRRRHPEISQGVRRTLERRIRDWRSSSCPIHVASFGQNQLSGQHIVDDQMRLEAESRETNSAVIAVEMDGARAATVHQIDAALRLASKNKGPGDRRRPNPLASVLNSVILSILRNMPAEGANAVFEEIVRHHPEISPEMRISLLRHVRAPSHEALPGQDHCLTIGFTFDFLRSAQQGLIRICDMPLHAQKHESISDILKFCRSGTPAQRNKALLALGVVFELPLSHLAKYSISSAASLHRWKARFLKFGFEKLIRAIPRTKLRFKDGKISAAVFKTLHEPPRLHGFPRTNWRQADLKRALEGKGISISVWTIRRAIRAAKYQWRKAKVVLTSNDPDYRSKVDRIKHILGSLGDDECFFSIDEYGPFKIRLMHGRKLCAPGEVPSVPQWQKSRGTLIITAALELRTNQVTHFYSEQKNTGEMIKMVDLLRREHKSMAKLYISWDAAGWHISKALGQHVEFLNGWAEFDSAPKIELAPLPSRAQFLNVIESVFSGMSRAIIHNSDFENASQAMGAIDAHFANRNEFYRLHPKRAGRKLWGQERSEAEFLEENNCKDPRY